MPAPETVYVVAMPFRVATGEVLRGDRYQREAWEIPDEIDRTMKYSRFIVPLTRESYAVAIGSRAAGTVGVGFLVEELLEWGIIDPKAAERLHAAQAEGDWHGGYLIKPVKHGNFARFDVYDPRGALMRPQSFNKHERAVAFIDTLPALEQGGDAKESTDDVHVQDRSLEHAG